MHTTGIYYITIQKHKTEIQMGIHGSNRSNYKTYLDNRSKKSLCRRTLPISPPVAATLLPLVPQPADVCLLLSTATRSSQAIAPWSRGSEEQCCTGAAASVPVLQGSSRRRAPWSRGAEVLCCKGTAAAAWLLVWK
jgi:hypothetical protein